MNLSLSWYLKSINKIIEEIDQRSGLKFRSTTMLWLFRRIEFDVYPHKLWIMIFQSTQWKEYQIRRLPLQSDSLKLIGAEGSLLEFLGNDSIYDSFSGSDLPDFNFKPPPRLRFNPWTNSYPDVSFTTNRSIDYLFVSVSLRMIKTYDNFIYLVSLFQAFEMFEILCLLRLLKRIYSITKNRSNNDRFLYLNSKFESFVFFFWKKLSQI